VDYSVRDVRFGVGRMMGGLTEATVVGVGRGDVRGV